MQRRKKGILLALLLRQTPNIKATWQQQKIIRDSAVS